MTFKTLDGIKSLIYKTLSAAVKLKKPQTDFIIEIMFLFLSIKGRLNFLQFSRYGKFGEQRYRQQFEKDFDFLKFNKELTTQYGSGNFVIAFDPSYISKSGHKTYGVDKFWSGVAGLAKRGLEIGGIAAIDMDNKTAIHLEAVQTPTYKEVQNKQMTLLDWYAHSIIMRKKQLTAISKYLVVDAYFSKQPFIDKISQESDFHVISRLRNDAHLMYLYTGEPTGKRGRPKQYNGKIDLKNIDKTYFVLVEQNDEYALYHATVYSKALKRKINLAYQELKNDKKNSYRLFFSTDLEQTAIQIMSSYKNRFQIEFLYRDAKQHTGLNHSQARSEKKLHFHFNASLTAINLAKVEHWFSLHQEQRGAFSMSDIKTMYHNTLLLQRFIELFAIPAYKLKNNQNVKELINFGKIAA